MELLTLKEGKFLVKLARKTIEDYLNFGIKIDPPENTPSRLFEERGVFVTLKRYPSMELRGCIGYPEPVMPLVFATIDAAISAATRDPRFYPVRPEELRDILVEVTVLTPPEPLDVPPERLPEEIKVGRDGLIVRCGLASGLLLPQVPIEWGWSEEEFLSQTCVKAGLPPNCWLDPRCQFYRFQGQIFTEVEPFSEVVEEKIIK
ncbi:AMMECR1-domain protein [Desulfurobacterium thermolithotrophum DSM 11699]|uniref:Protein Dester_0090 n=1 Tax=Desulfurobacterium thermolithotrophum (strain DSM 11699 / BSA) TaxID=868864 RepID=F0S0U5_DESTD|nr:TIGR00296 family protein [Desulfurobacterium thermolithotrophum]ADY72749.1 AMMECR1-domain protein [Desulfurobacterium thermolithotrophum DSM 11699]